MVELELESLTCKSSQRQLNGKRRDEVATPTWEEMYWKLNDVTKQRIAELEAELKIAKEAILCMESKLINKVPRP